MDNKTALQLHEENKKIQEEMIKFQREQNKFNKILALATSVLAFDIIYRLFILPNRDVDIIQTGLFYFVSITFLIIGGILIKNNWDIFINKKD